MATGWERLGDALGGIDREGAFNEGRLRTAQTENALAQARKHQLENVAAEAQARARRQTADMFAKHGVEGGALFGNLMEAGYGEYQDVMQGELRRQELGNRGVLSDPTADPLAQFAAGQGVQGKVLPRVDDVGTGVYTDLTTGKPNVQLTPLGDSMVAENAASARASDATAQLRGVQAGDPDYQTVSGANGPGQVKAPSGYEMNPSYDPSLPDGPDNPKLRPITGGPSDVNTPKALGSRERQVIARIFNAAANTAADLGNIASMPSGASTGVLGVGSKPGVSITEAVVSSLKNRISPEEVRIYNATLGGLSNQLSTLEKSGLAGSDALAAQYDSLALRPEDDVGTKMYKMAVMRQTVESALQTQIAQGVLPRDLTQYANQLLDKIREAVPYTPRDVLALGQSKNPQATIRDVVNAHRGTPSGVPGVPTATPPASTGNIPTFATEAEAEAAGLAPGTRVIIGGVSGTWQ